MAGCWAVTSAFRVSRQRRTRLRASSRAIGMLASSGTRLFWGNDVRRPTYFVAPQVFLRVLGLIYLIAFVSLWVQVDGLIGAKVCRRWPQFLPAAHEQLGAPAHLRSPDALLAQLERRIPAFALRRRRRVSLLLMAGLAACACLCCCSSSAICRSRSQGRRSSVSNGTSFCSKLDSSPSSSRPGAGE